RDAVPGMSNFRAYLEPIADCWREILLRSIFYLAQKQNVQLPVLWLYPRKLPALAHMSHDTDGNEPEKAHRLVEILDEAKIKATSSSSSGSTSAASSSTRAKAPARPAKRGTTSGRAIFIFRSRFARRRSTCWRCACRHRIFMCSRRWNYSKRC